MLLVYLCKKRVVILDTKLQSLIADLSEKISSYGVVSFEFSVDLDPELTISQDIASLNPNPSKSPLIHKKTLSYLKKMQVHISSDDGYLSFNEHYLATYAKRDTDIIDFIKSMPGYFLFSSPKDETNLSQNFRRLMANRGYQSRMGWTFPVEQQRPWMGVYILALDTCQADTQLTLIKRGQELSRLLKEFQDKFIENHSEKLNPWVNQKWVNQKGIAIIQMLAQGASTDEIGQSLNLTKRGIDYHVEVLKEKFNAKNRAQLVSRAHDLGLFIKGDTLEDSDFNWKR